MSLIPNDDLIIDSLCLRYVNEHGMHRVKHTAPMELLGFISKNMRELFTECNYDFDALPDRVRFRVLIMMLCAYDRLVSSQPKPCEDIEL